MQSQDVHFEYCQDLIARGGELNERHARGTLFSCLFSVYSRVSPRGATFFCVFEAIWIARTMRDTYERNNIYSCVSFPFIQVSSPRAYLAPRVLHSLSSARLKLLRLRAVVPSFSSPPPPTLRLNGSEFWNKQPYWSSLTSVSFHLGKVKEVASSDIFSSFISIFA